MAFWQHRAKELEGQERSLHAGLDVHVRKVIADKKLILFKEMLIEAGFPGAIDIIEHFMKGFPVAGEFPVTSILPADERLATGSVDDLIAIGFDP